MGPCTVFIVTALVFDTFCSDAFDQRCGVGILRVQEGLTCGPAKPNVLGGTHTASSVRTVIVCVKSNPNADPILCILIS